MDSNKTKAAQRLMEAFLQFRRLHWNQSPLIGIKQSELLVLHCIKQKATAGNEGIKISEISKKLRVTSPTVTQLVNSLETNGYVERSTDQIDKRAVRIKLTDKGENVLNKASDAFFASFKGLVEYLGEEKSNALAQLLSDVFVYFNEVAMRKRDS